MGLISFPPRPTGTDRSAQFMQWVWDSIKFLNQLNESQGTTSGRTTRGTFVIPQPGGTGKGASLQFKGQWVDGTYAKGDIVICQLPNEEDNGYEGGTFIANSGVVLGDLHPGLVVQTATATATTDGSAITAISVTDGGEGYVTAPGVTISGPGHDGAAHAILSGTKVGAIAIDNPGAGYASASVTIAAPTKVQRWDYFAVRPRESFTMKPVNQARKKRLLKVDSGRDLFTGIRILAQEDSTDPTNTSKPSWDLNTADIAGIGGPGQDVKFRLAQICIDGEWKNVILFMGSPF